MQIIIICVFAIYFINAGLMYLLAPMKMQLPLISYLELGIYQDFNQYWYADIGYQIISVLVLKAIFPPLELIALLAKDRLLQSWDQRKFCRKLPPSETRKSSHSSYQ